MPERKFVLTKIAAGDYLLPANDAKTVYRVAVYEDGPSHGVEAMERDEMRWGVWRWLGDPHCVDVSDWRHWSMVEAIHETRRAAVESALSGGETER